MACEWLVLVLAPPSPCVMDVDPNHLGSKPPHNNRYGEFFQLYVIKCLDQPHTDGDCDYECRVIEERATRQQVRV